jgi:hypothetical protein
LARQPQTAAAPSRIAAEQRKEAREFNLPVASTTPAQALPQPPVLTVPSREAPRIGSVDLRAIPPPAAAREAPRGNAAAGTRAARVLAGVPLFKKARPDFVPPKVLREVSPEIPASLRGSLKPDASIDVKVHVDRAGQVEYAELLSNAADAGREATSLAVFSSRRWKFAPAQLAGEPVPSEVILRFRVSSADQRRQGGADGK